MDNSIGGRTAKVGIGCGKDENELSLDFLNVTYIWASVWKCPEDGDRRVRTQEDPVITGKPLQNLLTWNVLLFPETLGGNGPRLPRAPSPLT